MLAEKQRFPSLTEIDRHCKDLEHENNRVLTSTEIDYMVNEKQKLGKVSVPLARQKLLLITEKEKAVEEDRHDEAAHIAAKLNRLESVASAEKNSSYSGLSTGGQSTKDVWAQLNERNRKINREEAARAERLAKLERADPTKDSKPADPFARIKAISTHNFSMPGPGVVSPIESGGQPSAGIAATTPSETSANNSGKISPIESPMKAGDAFEEVLADVEIDIDI